MKTAILLSLTFMAGAPPGSVGDAFAQRARRWKRQLEDPHDERDDGLVVAAENTAGQHADVAGPERLDQAEQDAADHRAGEVADAAEDRGGERLQAGQEAHRVLDRAVVGGVHHPGQRGERGADHEGCRDHGVGLHAHQAGDARVLGGRPHRAAQLGAVDEVHQPGQRDRGRHQDQDLHGVDDRAADVERLARQQDRERLVVRLPDDHRERLQQQAHADRGDQRGEPRRVAQRPVGDLLDREVEDRADDDRRDQRDQEQQPARQAQAAHRDHHGPARQRPDHQHVAVREVDQVDDAVDHRVAERDERVHAAQHQPVDDLLDERFHASNSRLVFCRVPGSTLRWSRRSAPRQPPRLY
jgi:hypothetical protein